MWGWVEDAWDAVTDAAGAVWHFGKGIVNFGWQGAWWLVNTFVGLLEVLGTFLGIMFWKQIRVQGVVLLDEKRLPVADPEDMQEVLDLAKDVFAEQAKVRLISPVGRVTYVPEAAPTDVLEPGCDAEILGAQFTNVGDGSAGISGAGLVAYLGTGPQ